MARWKNEHELSPNPLASPGMTVNYYGRGTAVYISGDIFTGYYLNQFHGIRDIIEEAMNLADSKKIIDTDAPIAVEFSLRKQNNDMIIHIINNLVDWDMDEEGALSVDNIPPVGPFQLQIRCEKEPARVILKPSNTELDWSFENNKVWVTIPQIHIHEALVLENALSLVSSIREHPIPDKFHVSQNYPNPFNLSTSIEIQIPHDSYVKIRIFNILGQEIYLLADKVLPEGIHTFVWDGKNKNGHIVPSGTYLYAVKTADFSHVKKMVLLK